jgi:hypothetical protein
MYFEYFDQYKGGGVPREGPYTDPSPRPTRFFFAGKAFSATGGANTAFTFSSIPAQYRTCEGSAVGRPCRIRQYQSDHSNSFELLFLIAASILTNSENRATTSSPSPTALNVSSAISNFRLTVIHGRRGKTLAGTLGAHPPPDIDLPGEHPILRVVLVLIARSRIRRTRREKPASI